MRLVKGFYSYSQVGAQNRVYKVYENYAVNLGLFKNEVLWYLRFNKYQGRVGRTPKLLSYHKNILTLEYVGEPISKATIPYNFKDQLRQIAAFLQFHQCQHCDITPENLLILRNRIYLIDFGWAVNMGEDPYQKWSGADRIILDCMGHPYRSPNWPDDKFSLATIYKEFSGTNDSLDFYQ